jgi:CubicO group peptidase (beta-lactamase class C family)
MPRQPSTPRDRTSFALILLTSTLVQMSTHGPSLAAQARRPSATEVANAVDSLAQEVIRARLVPGIGVALVMDGRTVLARSYGFADVTRGVRADDRTLWYTASTSKAFMGFAVSLLATEGRIDLDAPITAHLPGVRWHRDVRPESLSLASFLSHTSGLEGSDLVTSAAFTGEIPEARWADLLAHAAPTGSRGLSYTNFGYNVAGMVVDRIHPRGWKDFLETRVFAPAGMRETHHRMTGLDRARIAMPHTLGADDAFATAPFQKTDATLNAAGGHLAAVGDLARFTIAQMDSGMLDGRRVYPQAAVERSHRLLATHTDARARRFAHFDREGWGAGWDIGAYEGERMVSRFGSYAGTRSHLSFLPRRRIGFVALTNGGLGTATDLLAAFAFDLEAGRSDAHQRAAERFGQLVTQRAGGARQVAAGDSVRRSRQAQPLAHPLGDFAGSYTSPTLGTIEFRHVDGRLGFRWGALSGPVEILDAAANMLRIEMALSGTPVAFRFPPSGPASALTIQGRSFTRTEGTR